MRHVKFVLPAFLLAALAAGAAHGAPTQERGGKPIHIKSDRFEAETQANRAIFIGNVVAKQDDMTMHADRMVVVYTEAGDDVDRVESTGNVRIVQGPRTGTAGKAVYDNRRGTVTLTENPRIVQGADTITGTEIVYDLSAQRSTVTAAPGGKVEAVITPRKKEAK